jgi:hypothetical protein
MISEEKSVGFCTKHIKIYREKGYKGPNDVTEFFESKSKTLGRASMSFTLNNEDVYDDDDDVDAEFVDVMNDDDKDDDDDDNDDNGDVPDDDTGNHSTKTHTKKRKLSKSKDSPPSKRGRSINPDSHYYKKKSEVEENSKKIMNDIKKELEKCLTEGLSWEKALKKEKRVLTSWKDSLTKGMFRRCERYIKEELDDLHKEYKSKNEKANVGTYIFKKAAKRKGAKKHRWSHLFAPNFRQGSILSHGWDTYEEISENEDLP